jgi:hypothetical protein
MRLHHSAAHAGAESASGRFGQICSDATPRVSGKSPVRANPTFPANTIPIAALIDYAMKTTVTGYYVNS